MDNNLFDPLPVKVRWRNPSSGRRFMTIFIGKKSLCTLEWMEPVLPGGNPHWWLDHEPSQTSVNRFCGLSYLSPLEKVRTANRTIGRTREAVFVVSRKES